MATHPGFHSLHEETAASLDVTGTVPAWLNGTLTRNGPGAFSVPGGSSVDHWFDGFAMLYRFTFDPGSQTGSGDGDAVHYRNRFLRTDACEAARDGSFEGGFATGGDDAPLASCDVSASTVRQYEHHRRAYRRRVHCTGRITAAGPVRSGHACDDRSRRVQR